MVKIFRKKWYFFLLILLILGFSIWQSPLVSKTTIKAEKTYKVTRHHLRDELSLSGEIDAEEKTTLRFQSSGKLSWVGVKEGDYIEKYQAVASLDTREVQQNLKKYLNSYVNERLDYDQELQDNQIKYTGGLSEDARREAIRVLDKAQNDLNNAVIDVELRKLAIEYSTLYSPIDGLVVSVTTPFTGVNITPSQAEFIIINPNSLYFSATADQTDVVKLKEGMRGDIIFDSYPEDIFQGELYFISFTPKEDETGTVYTLKFRLDEQSLSLPLKMKMTGDLNILISESKNVITIPVSYVKKDNKGEFVTVLENNSNDKRYIKTSREVDGDVIVINGLSEGEEIYDL